MERQKLVHFAHSKTPRVLTPAGVARRRGLTSSSLSLPAAEGSGPAPLATVECDVIAGSKRRGESVACSRNEDADGMFDDNDGLPWNHLMRKPASEGNVLDIDDDARQQLMTTMVYAKHGCHVTLQRSSNSHLLPEGALERISLPGEGPGRNDGSHVWPSQPEARAATLPLPRGGHAEQSRDSSPSSWFNSLQRPPEGPRLTLPPEHRHSSSASATTSTPSAPSRYSSISCQGTEEQFRRCDKRYSATEVVRAERVGNVIDRDRSNNSDLIMTSMTSSHSGYIKQTVISNIVPSSSSSGNVVFHTAPCTVTNSSSPDTFHAQSRSHNIRLSSLVTSGTSNRVFSHPNNAISPGEKYPVYCNNNAKDTVHVDTNYIQSTIAKHVLSDNNAKRNSDPLPEMQEPFLSSDVLVLNRTPSQQATTQSPAPLDAMRQRHGSDIKFCDQPKEMGSWSRKSNNRRSLTQSDAGPCPNTSPRTHRHPVVITASSRGDHNLSTTDHKGAFGRETTFDLCDKDDNGVSDVELIHSQQITTTRSSSNPPLRSPPGSWEGDGIEEPPRSRDVHFSPRRKRDSMRLATQGYSSMSDLTISVECLDLASESNDVFNLDTASQNGTADSPSVCRVSGDTECDSVSAASSNSVTASNSVTTSNSVTSSNSVTASNSATSSSTSIGVPHQPYCHSNVTSSDIMRNTFPSDSSRGTVALSLLTNGAGNTCEVARRCSRERRGIKRNSLKLATSSLSDLSIWGEDLLASVHRDGEEGLDEVQILDSGCHQTSRSNETDCCDISARPEGLSGREDVTNSQTLSTSTMTKSPRQQVSKNSRIELQDSPLRRSTTSALVLETPRREDAGERQEQQNKIKRNSMRLATSSISDLSWCPDDVDGGVGEEHSGRKSLPTPSLARRCPDEEFCTPDSQRRVSRATSYSSEVGSSYGSFYSCQGSEDRHSAKLSPIKLRNSQCGNVRRQSPVPNPSSACRPLSGQLTTCEDAAVSPSQVSIPEGLGTAVGEMTSRTNLHIDSDQYRAGTYVPSTFSTCRSGPYSRPDNARPLTQGGRTPRPAQSNVLIREKVRKPSTLKTPTFHCYGCGSDHCLSSRCRTQGPGPVRDYFKPQDSLKGIQPYPALLQTGRQHHDHAIVTSAHYGRGNDHTQEKQPDRGFVSADNDERQFLPSGRRGTSGVRDPDYQFSDDDDASTVSDSFSTLSGEDQWLGSPRSPPSLGRPKRKVYAGFDSQPLPMDSFLSDSSSVYTDGTSCCSRAPSRSADLENSHRASDWSIYSEGNARATCSLVSVSTPTRQSNDTGISESPSVISGDTASISPSPLSLFSPPPVEEDKTDATMNFFLTTNPTSKTVTKNNTGQRDGETFSTSQGFASSTSKDFPNLTGYFCNNNECFITTGPNRELSTYKQPIAERMDDKQVKEIGLLYSLLDAGANEEQVTSLRQCRDLHRTAASMESSETLDGSAQDSQQLGAFKASSYASFPRPKIATKHKFFSSRDIFDLFMPPDKNGLDHMASLTSLEKQAQKMCRVILCCNEMKPALAVKGHHV